MACFRSRRPPLAFAAAALLFALSGCFTKSADRGGDGELATLSPEAPELNEFGLVPTLARNQPKTFPTECVGPAGTGRTAIFLHGMLRREEADALMRAYRDGLRKIAEATGYRIAIPQAYTACPRNPSIRCWNGESPEGVQATYDAIVRGAGRCFDTNAGFGLIGFSNGGFYAGRVAMRCLDPSRLRWILAMGSAGLSYLSVSDDMSACAPLALLIGTKDGTNAKARAFASELKGRKLPVTFQTFPGGHDVPYPIVAGFLRRRAP